MFPGRLISLRGDVKWTAKSPDRALFVILFCMDTYRAK